MAPAVATAAGVQKMREFVAAALSELGYRPRAGQPEIGRQS